MTNIDLMRLLDDKRIMGGNLIKDVEVAVKGGYTEDLISRLVQLLKVTEQQRTLIKFWLDLLRPFMSDKTLSDGRGL
jgi:hypothetical protein